MSIIMDRHSDTRFTLSNNLSKYVYTLINMSYSKFIIEPLFDSMTSARILCIKISVLNYNISEIHSYKIVNFI